MNVSQFLALCCVLVMPVSMAVPAVVPTQHVAQQAQPAAVVEQPQQPVEASTATAVEPVAQAAPVADSGDLPVNLQPQANATEADPDLPLDEITKPAAKKGVQTSEILKVYLMLFVLLAGGIGLLYWLNQKGWLGVLLGQPLPIKQPLKGEGAAPSATPAKPTALIPTVSQQLAASEKAFYQPLIQHRLRLGTGKELLTIYQAGQWLLVGVTPQQIQLVANLSEPTNVPQASAQPEFELAAQDHIEETVKSSLAKESINDVYPKYIATPPTPAPVVTPPSPFMEATPVAMPPAATISTPAQANAELIEEIELPDFEDWLEPPDQDLSQPVSAYPKRDQV